MFRNLSAFTLRVVSAVDGTLLQAAFDALSVGEGLSIAQGHGKAVK
jgi:hypothetical protein